VQSAREEWVLGGAIPPRCLAGEKAPLNFAGFPAQRLRGMPADDMLSRGVGMSLAFGCMAAYLWGALAARSASQTFWNYMETNELQARVAQVDGFQGPVQAVFTSDFSGADNLNWPTRHQRWWGLVQDDLIGTSVPIGHALNDDPSGILKVRMYLFIAVNVVYGLTAAQVAQTCYSSPSPLIFIELLTFGMTTFANGTLITSLYAMYWDDAHQLAYINHVPGWAYFWVNLVMVLRLAASVCVLFTLVFKSAICLVPTTLLTLASFFILIYTLSTIALPLLGYTVVFCWSFVDRMVERGPGLRMGLAPFDVGPSMALDAPFQAIVYVGITSTLVSFIAMYLLRDQVVAVALETRRQHQLQSMQNSAMV